MLGLENSGAVRGSAKRSTMYVGCTISAESTTIHRPGCPSAPRQRDHTIWERPPAAIIRPNGSASDGSGDPEGDGVTA
ncbi:MAG: hypothetical protein JO036_12075 [Candidatus Eremiobacteraeota bacterium]|nr:hypothetical protein [Candidatus Eremiobacteraeota bacterium]